MAEPTDAKAVKHTFHLEIDMRSGRMIGTSNASPESEFSREISSRIWESLGKISKKELLISNEIEDAISRGNHKLAAELALSDRAKASIYFALGENLLRATLKINREEIEDTVRQELLFNLVSLASKVGKHALVFHEIKEILDSFAMEDRRIRHSLRNMLALASYERGAHETAISIWQDLLQDCNEIEAGERGWIYRNLAYALKRQGDKLSDIRAETNYQHSADAFLEAGDKIEAARSLAQMARLYEGRSAEEAIKKYDDMLELISDSGLSSDEVRATTFHAKARRLMEIGDFPAAKNAALEAVRLRRGVLGTEEELISSLHLISLVAGREGDINTANACSEEAKNLELRTSSKHFALAERISKLFDSASSEDAVDVLRQAESSGDVNLIANAKVASIHWSKTLSPLEKLGELETLHASLERQGIRGKTLTPVRLAIAILLSELSEFARAANWYRKIVAEQPLDAQTGASLVAVLWKANQWGEAGIVLREQIQRFGEKPGYLHAYGRSLFEAGDMNGAVSALTKSIRLAEAGSRIEKQSRELRERALEFGGTLQPEPSNDFVPHVVSLSEINGALVEFGTFISSVKRMSFWRKQKGQRTHQWIPRPESLGQTLLHTFLRARFGECARVFEEVGSGAGRLDVLVQFEGGLSVIVELKMCGRNYSTAYARSGEDQIRHYMKNQRINVGFLVVFDARDHSNGAPLVAGSDSQFTIREVLIDSRPTA